MSQNLSITVHFAKFKKNKILKQKPKLLHKTKKQTKPILPFLQNHLNKYKSNDLDDQKPNPLTKYLPKLTPKS
jgi:hypothetical protein